jgi:hypothetical protein
MSTGRVITHAIVFLLLGAIVNVAVAWGLLLAMAPFNPAFLVRSDALAWPFEPPELWPSSPDSVGERHTFGRTQQAWLSATGSSPYAMMGVSLSGLPFRTLSSKYWVASPTPSRIIQMPISLLWPGFAINTVFYAAILWMLFAAPFALRKWRRIRRGPCPKCGYDLRGLPADTVACPECGATR